MKIMSRLQSGFTLIELLVALALGIFLSFGLIQIFQNTKNIAGAETALSRVQEVGRFALGVMVGDLRMSGFHGCADPNNMDVNVIASNGVSDWAQITLLGYEVASTGTFSPALTSSDSLYSVQDGTASGSITARPGSDVIQVVYGDLTGAELVNNISRSGASAVLGPPASGDPVNGNPTCLDDGDLVFLANCSSALIFRNTNDTCDDDGVAIADGGGNVSFAYAASDNTVGANFEEFAAGARMLGFREVSFFVADTGRTAPGGDDVYALYRVVNGNVPEELVEGVEFLQVQYGETLSTGNVRFVSAGTSGLNMSNVKTIRVGMLVQGLEASLPSADTRSYVVAGSTISYSGAVSHSGGRYLRKPFVTTIKLRNRRS